MTLLTGQTVARFTTEVGPGLSDLKVPAAKDLQQPPDIILDACLNDRLRNKLVEWNLELRAKHRVSDGEIADIEFSYFYQGNAVATAMLYLWSGAMIFDDGAFVVEARDAHEVSTFLCERVEDCVNRIIATPSLSAPCAVNA